MKGTVVKWGGTLCDGVLSEWLVVSGTLGRLGLALLTVYHYPRALCIAKNRQIENQPSSVCYAGVLLDVLLHIGTSSPLVNAFRRRPTNQRRANQH